MNKKQTQAQSHVSRREALKLGAMGIAGISLPGCGLEKATSTTSFSANDLHPESDQWNAVRSHFNTLGGLSYLNNASIGMPPAVVVHAVADGYRAQSEDPIHAKHQLQASIRDQVLPKLGHFLGTLPTEVTLTRNASMALYIQASGLDIRRGDEVIITSQEHPAGRAPWSYRSLREDIAIKEIHIPSPLPPVEDILAEFEAARTPKTRAISFCHVTRGGHLYPVKELCTWARERGIISLVDGAQAVGQFSVDLKNLGCDAYAASLHKWTLAPCGTGFMYISQASADQFRSIFSADPDTIAYGAPGTADLPVRAGIGPALAFIESIGLDRTEARCRYLSDYLKNRLSNEDGVTLLSGTRHQSAPGSTIFEMAGVDALAAVDQLADVNVHIDEHQRDGHNAIRISTHFYNTRTEIDNAVDHLLSIRGTMHST